MATLTPRFSAERTVREYTETYYIPAANAVKERRASHAAIAGRIVETSHALEQSWPALRFGEMNVQTGGGEHRFKVQVLLHDLDPRSIKVELYANGSGSSGAGTTTTHHEMTNDQPPAGHAGTSVYTATVPATRPVSDYTPRVIEKSEGEGRISIPLEGSRIVWQR
jgi:starch phosphorylase